MVMFSGIIKATAKVKRADKKSGSLFLRIEKPKGWQIKVGDSIATDGACLTVSKVNRTEYRTELMPETLSKTSFGKQIPSKVNLELSLRLSDVINGHLVLGHVDSIGRIEKIKRLGSAKIYTINFPSEFAKLVAKKGSIAIDGVSLTVVDVGKNWFSVSLVDYTIRHTTLGSKRTGDLVNLEFDVIAKYLDRLISHAPSRTITI